MNQILIVFAIVFEALAMLGVPANRFNLMAAGLFCYFLTLLPLFR